MDEKQEINFPVDWSYRVIVDAANENCCAAIADLLKEYGVEAKLEKKDKSANGKYQAYRLPVLFDSKEMMEDLSRRLAKVDGVKFLL
jgi:putative lipoic acid-binding regulatory protein